MKFVRLTTGLHHNPVEIVLDKVVAVRSEEGEHEDGPSIVYTLDGGHFAVCEPASVVREKIREVEQTKGDYGPEAAKAPAPSPYYLTFARSKADAINYWSWRNSGTYALAPFLWKYVDGLITLPERISWDDAVFLPGWRKNDSYGKNFLRELGFAFPYSFESEF